MKNFRKYLVAGLVVTLPAFLTAFIVLKILQGFLSVLGSVFPVGPFVSSLVEGSFFTDNFLVRGIMFILTYSLLLSTSVFILTFIGFLTLNYINKERGKWIERLFLNIPLSTTIYSTIKQISSLLLSEDFSFNKVVMLEYPREGVYSLGFLTNENVKLGKNRDLKDHISVFVPTSPNPVSGMFVVVKKSDLVFLDIGVEEAIRLIVSGGMLDNN